jgi:hypothetical protein
MASRKQRRRRQKERRHEYEFVYVDEQGHEVEVDPSELERQERQGTRRNGTKAPAAKGNRAIRKVDPPSLKRVVRRALIFAPLIFAAFLVLNQHQAIGIRLLLTAFYTAFFIPFMYLMDRAMYRTYLRRTGQAPPPRTTRSGRQSS